MDTIDFKKLMELYWSGETTLEQEQDLRKYLSTSEGQQEFPKEALLFNFYASEGSIESTVNSFPEASLLKSEKNEEGKSRIIQLLPQLRKIAAAFILVIGAYFVWNTNSLTSTKNNYVEIEDPKEALKITRQALALLSKNVDKSEVVLKQSIAKLSISKFIKK